MPMSPQTIPMSDAYALAERCEIISQDQLIPVEITPRYSGETLERFTLRLDVRAEVFPNQIAPASVIAGQLETWSNRLQVAALEIRHRWPA